MSTPDAEEVLRWLSTQLVDQFGQIALVNDTRRHWHVSLNVQQRHEAALFAQRNCFHAIATKLHELCDACKNQLARKKSRADILRLLWPMAMSSPALDQQNML